MTEVCDKINEEIEDFVDNGSLNTLCELITKDNQPHPITVTTRRQVAPNDRYDAVIYYRILDSPVNAEEPDMWGRTFRKKVAQRLRMVVFVKHSKGESWIYDLINELPDTLVVTGYRAIDLGPNFNLIVDQQGIYQQELGANDYERHATSWNIYAIEFDVNLIRC